MNTVDMTKGSPIKLLLQFSIPILVGNLFQQAYTLADRIGSYACILIAVLMTLLALVTTKPMIYVSSIILQRIVNGFGESVIGTFTATTQIELLVQQSLLIQVRT